MIIRPSCIHLNYSQRHKGHNLLVARAEPFLQVKLWIIVNSGFLGQCCAGPKVNPTKAGGVPSGEHCTVHMSSRLGMCAAATFALVTTQSNAGWFLIICEVNTNECNTLLVEY